MLSTGSPILSVLISTLNDRIINVCDMLLPEKHSNICYIVSFQYTDSMFLEMLPDVLKQRSDVKILPFPATGLCKNRNNCLRHCTTPLALICDDDIRFSSKQFDEIISLFSSNSTDDVIHFSNHTIALRMSVNLPMFDTRFGVGSARLSCGENEIFFHQARLYGFKVRHLNRSSSGHLFEDDALQLSSMSWNRYPYDKKVRRTWGALQYMLHRSFTAPFYIIFQAITYPFKKEAGTFEASSYSKNSLIHRLYKRWLFLLDMLDGLHYIITNPLNDSIAEEIPIDFQPIDIWKMP